MFSLSLVSLVWLRKVTLVRALRQKKELVAERNETAEHREVLFPVAVVAPDGCIVTALMTYFPIGFPQPEEKLVGAFAPWVPAVPGT